MNRKRNWMLILLAAVLIPGSLTSQDKLKLRLSASSSASDPRARALLAEFSPAVSSFASFEPHWNSTLYKQGTELEAIIRGNLEMTLASSQEMAVFIPEFSIFAAGYVFRSAQHQLAVFADPLMDPLKKKAEKLGLKLLSVMYLGKREVNLRTDKKIMTPEDLNGIRLRMPGTQDWQFLGKSLGASPTVMAFAEVYTGLQTGSIDGQDNPLPTMVVKKFYEVTSQVVLTDHLVDLNYIVISNKLWRKLKDSQRQMIYQAAVAASTTARQEIMAKEESLVGFLRQQGLKVYTPDVPAFRKYAQQQYTSSKIAKKWPKGMLEKINAIAG